MLDMVLDNFEADAGSVMLEKEGYLTIEVSKGLDEVIVKQTRQKIGTGIAGWVAATGQPLRLDGKVDDPRFHEVIERSEDIRSSLCVPVAVKEEVVGVLMIRRADKREFKTSDLSFLQSVADLAAVALENARLFESERAHRRLLQLGHERLQATLSSMADGVVVFDPEGRVLTSNQVARELLRPLVGQDLGLLWTEHSSLFPQGQTGLESGEKYLIVVSTPLYLDGREEGSVLVFRDETSKRELERMKSEFLSMVSHELKTPITTIGAFLELLLVREFPEERRNHFLTICQSECQRLQNLIDQLLHLTRLEAGRFVLQKERQHLGPLVRDCLPAFRETQPDHEFHFRNGSADPILEIDSMLVTQAVTNLLSNAVKYSPKGGAIDVGIDFDGNEAVVSVRDHGVGIDSRFLHLVFEKFYRVDNSLTRETGGTGLGLANVKNIAQAHGGRAWVESELGEGSIFYFSLPCVSGKDERC